MPYPPVSEPDDIVLRVGSAGQADAHDEQADESDDLDEREPELEFAKEADTGKVDEEDREVEDRDVDGDVDLVRSWPVLQND